MTAKIKKTKSIYNQQNCPIRNAESSLLAAQLCQTLCDPKDCSLPGLSIHGIFQARTLEWVAISFPGNLPNPGIKPRSPTLQADPLPSEPPGNPQKFLRENKSYVVRKFIYIKMKRFKIRINENKIKFLT